MKATKPDLFLATIVPADALPALDDDRPVAPGPELASFFDPAGRTAEQFRSLRCELGLSLGAPAAGQGQAVAVVGAARGEGRSWVAANLALSMARRGGRVALVDADLRHPRLDRMFGLRAEVGLATMLEARSDYGCMRPVTSVPGLYLMPAGAPTSHSLELLERNGLALVLRQLRTRFTHIVIDTPAAELGPDAVVVASHCDGSLIVARNHHSPLPELHRLKDAIQRVGATVAGVAINER
jgi:protein-tyrosine kinase